MTGPAPSAPPNGGIRRAAASLALVLLVLAAGCTATPDPPASPSSSDTSARTPTGTPTVTPAGTPEGTGSAPSTGPGGAISLTIVVDPGEGVTTSWTLTCDPAGGDHPDPATACQVLADHTAALQPVRQGVSCTQVFGGPETATVTGTYRGEAVNARFARNNGCETTRWTDLTGLLPVGGAR